MQRKFLKGRFTMAKFQTVNVLGVDFINTTNHDFLTQLKADSQANKNRFVVTANPEIVLAAKQNPQLAAAIKSSDYTTADGIGIIKGAKILKTPLPERITGYDTMCALLDWANANQKRVYFLGAKPSVLADLKKKLAQNYPDLVIAGSNDGYFQDEGPIVNDIKQAKPDFVFVALGFPKQELFIANHRQVAAAIWMGVGGSFDVLAGHVKRAPAFWVNHHIEWLYRLLKEPSRFVRMLALPKYLLLVYRYALIKK